MKGCYCGPYYAPKWVRRLMSYTFDKACKCHDECYEISSNNRIICDLKFAFHMLRELFSLGSRLVIGVHTWLIYLILVLLFGWISKK